MLSIKNLEVKYGNTVALSDFSLTIKRGEIYSLIGPSGCGKSTLLKVLCGIIKDYEGDIAFNDKVFSPKDVAIGYVPQQYGLLEWKTIRDNIFLPYKLNPDKALKEPEVSAIISSLEIDDLQSRYPSQLSGGQKQRAALARAFISQPDILLMDEPFSSLDTFTSEASQRLFLRLWEKYKVTTLFITHNIHEAVSIGEHIVVMSKSPGKIIHQVENPLFNVSEYQEEKLRFVASIINKIGY
ncbi:ABC transporter ATP-binding protein [Dysgonomonas sp. 521]|uniref:ABC transporter ATP-binding protein n=1 Tax=Dysgonomonas sp. 521 TaxID=2302932 RepID=UPI0013D1A6A9|nr:ABC transporter ATP-binding protein [Dysgonomonas sp. 521]NDV93807.1 ABC transporter ATP-binding protein [Dysgonomonas sp. 521]